MNDLLYFHSSVCIPRQREVQIYLRVLKNRLTPLFHDINAEIEKEADEIQRNYCNKLSSDQASTQDYYENIYADSINYGITLCEINGYIALLAIAGLYHLWERRVIEFLFKEIGNHWNTQYLQIKTFGDIKHTFLDYGIDIEHLNCYKTLNELRYVANAVKHGNGHSLDKLKDIDAAILHDNDEYHALHTGKWTISGVDLYPSQNIIDQYGGAIIYFWDHKQWTQCGDYHVRTREPSQPTSKKYPNR